MPATASLLNSVQLNLAACCAGVPPGSVAVNLNEEEQAAVGRLEAMGFDRQSVLEAFLACDRNETMAANFLLENAGEDM